MKTRNGYSPKKEDIQLTSFTAVLKYAQLSLTKPPLRNFSIDTNIGRPEASFMFLKGR